MCCESRTVGCTSVDRRVDTGHTGGAIRPFLDVCLVFASQILKSFVQVIMSHRLDSQLVLSDGLDRLSELSVGLASLRLRRLLCVGLRR